MSNQLSFDHVHYRSSNFEESRRFYVDIMGATELSNVPLAGNQNLQFVLAGVTLLFAPAGTDPVPAEPATERMGVYHIAFSVANCDEATEHYRSRGAVVAVEPFMANDNIRASFLAGPDGMWVELKQVVE